MISIYNNQKQKPSLNRQLKKCIKSNIYQISYPLTNKQNLHYQNPPYILFPLFIILLNLIKYYQQPYHHTSLFILHLIIKQFIQQHSNKQYNNKKSLATIIFIFNKNMINNQKTSSNNIFKIQDINTIIKIFAYNIQERFQELDGMKQSKYTSGYMMSNATEQQNFVNQRQQQSKFFINKYRQYKTKDIQTIKYIQKFIVRVQQILKFFKQRSKNGHTIQILSRKIQDKLNGFMIINSQSNKTNLSISNIGQVKQKINTQGDNFSTKKQMQIGKIIEFVLKLGNNGFSMSNAHGFCCNIYGGNQKNNHNRLNSRKQRRRYSMKKMQSHHSVITTQTKQNQANSSIPSTDMQFSRTAAMKNSHKKRINNNNTHFTTGNTTTTTTIATNIITTNISNRRAMPINSYQNSYNNNNSKNCNRNSIRINKNNFLSSNSNNTSSKQTVQNTINKIYGILDLDIYYLNRISNNQQMNINYENKLKENLIKQNCQIINYMKNYQKQYSVFSLKYQQQMSNIAAKKKYKSHQISGLTYKKYANINHQINITNQAQQEHDHQHQQLQQQQALQQINNRASFPNNNNNPNKNNWISRKRRIYQATTEKKRKKSEYENMSIDYLKFENKQRKQKFIGLENDNERIYCEKQKKIVKNKLRQ